MLEESATPSNDITLREFLDLLRRRRTIIIQTFVVVVAIGVVVTFMSKPIFRTSARILVEGKNMMLMGYDSRDPLGNLFLPPTGHEVDTQIEVLQSESLLKDVYKSAGVLPGSVRLSVKQVAQTDVIELNAESTQPEQAERVAKSVPSVYREYMTGNRKSEVKNALKFARESLDSEIQKLDVAQREWESFKKQARLVNVEAERQDLISRVGQAETQARSAESLFAGATARLDSLIASRNALPAFLETPTTTTNQTQIEQQIEKIAGLKADRAKLLLLQKPNSVPVQQIDAQIAEMENRLKQIPRNVTSVTRTPNPAIQTYEDKIAEARASLTTTRTEADKARAHAAGLTARLEKFNAIERQQDTLSRAVGQHRTRVEQLNRTVDDLSLREKTTHDPLMTITEAGSAVQVAPKKLNNMIYAMVAGLVLGFIFALLQDYLDDRINEPEEARRLLGVPALGYIPMVEKEDARLLRISRGHSLLESYRVLRSNVQFASVDGSLRSLLITSTTPGEGKSLTASNLAVAMALDDRRVILVDCDLRRPTLHEKFALQKQPGLTSVLLGRSTLEQALQDTEVPNLRILTAGPQPPNPAELLNSRVMHQLCEKLKEMADLVIFDSPPCLATADAQVLANKVDGVLYVIHIGEARRTAVRHSIELLHQARARVLGTVFNKIDLSNNRSDYYYGYYRYGYEPTGQLEDGKNSSDTQALPPRERNRDEDEEEDF